MNAQIEELDTLLVSLYVYGDELVPDEISRVLQASPTMARSKGSVRLRKGRQIESHVGVWSLESGIESLHLSQHIAAIFRMLGKQDVFIPSLGGVEEVQIDVFAASLRSKSANRYLDLQLELDDMRRLVGLGANLVISIVDTADQVKGDQAGRGS